MNKANDQGLERVLALEYEARARRNGGPSSAASDALGTAHKQAVSAAPAWYLRTGVIVDATASTGCYKVALDNGMGTIACHHGASLSWKPVGARDISSLTPDTAVLVAPNRDLTYGVIVAVLLLPNTDQTDQLDTAVGLGSSTTHPSSDWISLQSRCGFKPDRVHSVPFVGAEKTGWMRFADGHPMDQLHDGSHTIMSAFGGMIHLDDYMAQLSMGEDVGVYLFYEDGLLRLAGRNVQLRGPGYEQELLDVGGEIQHVLGRTPYGWEALGGLAPNTPLFKEREPEEVQEGPLAHYSYLEPISDRQRPFHRRVDRFGVVGHLGTTTIFLPPTPTDENDVYSYGRDPGTLANRPIAVGQDAWLPDGLRVIRSAAGMIWVHDPFISAVEELKRPEDTRSAAEHPNGFDTDSGESDEAQVPTPRTGDDEADLTAVLDREIVLPEATRPGQFHVPTPTDTVEKFGQSSAPLVNFHEFRSASELELPDAVTFKVDPLREEVQYRPVRTSFALTENPVWKGWAGEEIRFENGRIVLSAPGGIYLESGTDVAIFAGRHLALRSQKDIDVCSAKGSIRSKAHKHNMNAAGMPDEDGNPGEGVYLVHNPAPAKDPDFKDKFGDDVEGAGFIVNVAGICKLLTGDVKWTVDGDFKYESEGGDVHFECNLFKRTLDEATDILGSVTNSFTTSSAVIGAGLGVGGPLNVSGSANIGGSLNALGGIASGTSSGENDVASISDDAAESLQSGIDGATTTPDQAVEQEEEDLGTPEFSFPSSEQRGLDGWFLRRSYWQGVAIAQVERGGEDLPTWVEPPIVAGSQATMPFPGKEVWADGESALRDRKRPKQDPATGLPYAPTAPEWAEESEEPEQGPFEGRYRVIQDPND